MMTRSPVQVTLGEGNRHTAQFNDCERVYDLSSENEVGAVGVGERGETRRMIEEL